MLIGVVNPATEYDVDHATSVFQIVEPQAGPVLLMKRSRYAWAWACSCGARGSGYRTKGFGQMAAARHERCP